MNPKNYKLPILALCVFFPLIGARAQDNAPLNELSSVDDVLGYAKDTSVRIMAAHPEGTPGYNWGDAYLGSLSLVDRKTLLAAVAQIPTGGPDWRQARIEYFLVSGAVAKFADKSDIPMLLQVDTIDSLRPLALKKMADAPEVTAFLLTTLAQYQTTPPDDKSDKTFGVVLLLANLSHDAKVNATLADTMTKGTTDPNASVRYLLLLGNGPLEAHNRAANIVALVAPLKARVAAMRAQPNP